MHYIYHIVPDDFAADTLYPLSALQEKDPEAYEQYSKKYIDRQHIPKLYIPQLDCYRPDVVHFGAVHPKTLRDALSDAGFPQEFSYYEIDPNHLDQDKIIVYLNLMKADKNNLTEEDFIEFNIGDLGKLSHIPNETVNYYKKKSAEGKKPIPFLFIPHILYKGSVSLDHLTLKNTKSEYSVIGS